MKVTKEELKKVFELWYTKYMEGEKNWEYPESCQEYGDKGAHTFLALLEIVRSEE